MLTLRMPAPVIRVHARPSRGQLIRTRLRLYLRSPSGLQLTLGGLLGPPAIWLMWRAFGEQPWSSSNNFEICGLQKTDVDLVRRLLTVRRSYARPFPKNKRQRVVPIPEELVPFLTFALEAWPGVWLFPDVDGTPRTKFWQPEDILRRALNVIALLQHREA
jgi:hypothetical protein